MLHLHALESQGYDGVERIHSLRGLQLRVQDFRHILLVHFSGPAADVAALLDHLPSAEKLQEHDSEAVDVALGSEGAEGGELGVEVSRRAAHASREQHAGVLVVAGEGQPEVCDVRVQLLVQQDVRRLHVTMDDHGGGVVVQILQALGSARGDAQALLPAQAAAEPILMQAILQGAILHELENQHVLLVTVPDEAHQTPVVQLRQQVQLLVKRRLGHVDLRMGSLDCPRHPAENRSVHTPARALANKRIVRPETRRVIQLLHGETDQVSL